MLYASLRGLTVGFAPVLERLGIDTKSGAWSRSPPQPMHPCRVAVPPVFQ